MTFDPTQNRATLSPEAVAQLVADREAGTPGPWFVAGVRVKMDRQQWLAISRYDEDRKRDENICCAGYDPKDGLGSVDARRIARLPDIEAAYLTLAAENATLRAERDEARTWLGAANNEFGSAAWDWPDLWRRISQLKELSNSRWQSLNAAQDELATLRASEAAALEALAEIGAVVAAIEGADSLDKEMIRNIGTRIAALTPTADKEPKT